MKKPLNFEKYLSKPTTEVCYICKLNKPQARSF